MTGERVPLTIPTIDVVVAVRRIEQGTTLGPKMLGTRTVPLDASNEMALTDIESALGEVAVIDIVKEQAITPNMFLEWPEMPTEPRQQVPGEGLMGMIPTRDVVVATQLIEQGASIEREMLTVRPVPYDATTDMAFTDVKSALGKEAAIGILANQAISPNMLVAE